MLYIGRKKRPTVGTYKHETNNNGKTGDLITDVNISSQLLHFRLLWPEKGPYNASRQAQIAI